MATVSPSLPQSGNHSPATNTVRGVGDYRVLSELEGRTVTVYYCGQSQRYLPMSLAVLKPNPVDIEKQIRRGKAVLRDLETTLKIAASLLPQRNVTRAKSDGTTAYESSHLPALRFPIAPDRSE